MSTQILSRSAERPRLQPAITPIVPLLERHVWLVPLAFTLAYLPLALLVAAKKPFWNDELFTYYVSRLPSMTDILDALRTGAEQTPPLFYAITRASAALASTELAYRLPEIFGFWLMGVCLYLCVGRWASRAVAGIAASTPMNTAALYYATEARAYGIVLGLIALALLCWQRAGELRWRCVAAVGLGLSLALAVSSHYYAALAFIPLAGGELIRSWTSKRINLGVWIAFAVAAAVLLLHFPLLSSSQGYSAHFWAKPSFGAMLDSISSLLSPGATVLVVALVMSALLRSTSREPDRLPAAHEIVAAGLLTMLPLIGLVIATGVTGAYTLRYFLPCVIGLSVLFAAALQKLDAGHARLTPALFLVLCASGMLLQIRVLRELNRGAQSENTRTLDFLNKHAPGQKVVIADPHKFLELSHYRRDQDVSLSYVADAILAVKHIGVDTADRGLIQMKQWAHVDVWQLEDLEQKRPVMIYSKPLPFGWLVNELSDQRRPLRWIAQNGQFSLYAFD